MKKFVAVIAVLLFVAVAFQAAVAQGMGGGQGRAPRTPADQAKSLKDSLSLTDEQVAKVTTVYEEQAKERTAMMEQMQGGDPEARRTAMQEFQTKYTEKIMKLLDDTQKKKYEEMQKAMQARRGQRQRNN
ncbi:MAG: hypothetical protein V1799_16170 [bacterium]